MTFNSQKKYTQSTINGAIIYAMRLNNIAQEINTAYFKNDFYLMHRKLNRLLIELIAFIRKDSDRKDLLKIKSELEIFFNEYLENKLNNENEESNFIDAEIIKRLENFEIEIRDIWLKSGLLTFVDEVESVIDW